MPSGSSSNSERLRLWLERGESGYWLRDAETGDAVRWDDPGVDWLGYGAVVLRSTWDYHRSTTAP